MKNTRKKKKKDVLPDTFSSYEEAGEFWDTHDSTDYIEHLLPVEAEVTLMRRHHEIEIEEEVIKTLERLASEQHISVVILANNLLKKQLAMN